jgi:hypothetical protein
MNIHLRRNGECDSFYATFESSNPASLNTLTDFKDVCPPADFDHDESPSISSKSHFKNDCTPVATSFVPNLTVYNDGRVGT